MDNASSLWLQLNPGTAYAAGADLTPEAVLDLPNASKRIVPSATNLSNGDTSPSARIVLAAVAAQAEEMRPIHALRETLEWVRALVYLERLESPVSENADRILGAGFPELARHANQGTVVDRTLSRSFVRSIGELASHSRLPAIERAAKSADDLFADVPMDPPWAVVAARPDLASASALDEQRYTRVLRDAYGITEPITELDARMDAELSQKSELLRTLAREIGSWLPGNPHSPEDVMSAIERERTSAEDALTVASTMTEVSLDDLDTNLIRLDDQDRSVRPEPTPAALISLITEGEEYLAGGLTATPEAHCFITIAKCGSLYTLANVLFHEHAHCWNMLKCSRNAMDLPAALRVAGSVGTALLEGIATLREREIYELYRDSETGGFASIFDCLGIDRKRACREFELDTEYWWVARVIRALFDFRVQTGRQPYADFVRSTSARTGLSEDRVHNFCFSFFERPGYAPCYAIGTLEVDRLRQELEASGMNRREFNTRIASIGMVPPAMWRDRMKGCA